MPKVETPALEFINCSSNPVIKDVEIRRKVRSHVMRAYRRETRCSLITHPYSQPSDRQDLVPSHDVPADEAVSFLERRLRFSARLYQTGVDSSRSDQFMCLPNTLTPAAYTLLKFYRQMYPGKAGLLSTPTAPYISQMLSHTATMSAFIMEAALLFRVHTVDPGFGATEYYCNAVNAIRNVSKAFDDQTERCSDATIGAITLLGVCEVHSGNFQGAETHFKALKVLVKARGGLQALGWNGILARQIFWVDYAWSVGTIRPPRLPATIREISNYEIVIEDLDNASVMRASFKAIASLLIELCLECETIRPSNDNEIPAGYSNRVMILESHLGNSLHFSSRQQNEESELLVPADIKQTFYLSAYMYDLAILRERPTFHYVFAVVLRHMVLIFTPINISMIRDLSSLAILFWTLFSASVLGEDGPDEAFFQERLRATARHLGITTWERAREELQKVGWVSRCCEERWSSVWHRTIQSQETTTSGPQPHDFQQGWNSLRTFFDDILNPTV